MESIQAAAREIREAQQDFFRTNITRDLDFRKEQLNKLYRAIKQEEPALLEALKKDLGKSEFEAYSNEIGLLYSEIKHTLKHLNKWARPKRAKNVIATMPGSSWIYPEPKGAILIFAPWNYPVQLLFMPLIAAMAAGNTAVLKPSELAPHSAEVSQRIIENTFDSPYIALFQGGPDVASALTEEAYDHIFFTGSTPVGRKIMAAAAPHLTPVTLELGGKSPVVVDETADLQQAARKILWGKFNNAGQTCVAPDYLLVQESILEDFLPILPEVIKEFYGSNPLESENYGRIISHRHFNRLVALAEGSPVYYGGSHEEDDLYLEPTILYPVSWEDPVMGDEIFGPLLPVLTYTDLDDAIEQIHKRPTPLAMYIFSQSKKNQRKLTHSVSFGGGGINTTILHVASHHLPFGGVGQSGMGHYHGKYGFRTLSHFKSIVSQHPRLDIPMAYPHKKISMKILRFLFS